MQNGTVLGGAGGRIDAPLAGRRLDEHLLGGRPSLPEGEPGTADAGAAAGELHATDGGVAVDLGCRRGLLGPDL